jgi:hypothetical protein
MKTSDPWIVFYIRLVSASLLCGLTIAFGLSMFAVLARTEDWVLEYPNWLMGCIYFLGGVVWIATMFLSRLRKPGSENHETGGQKPPS